MLYIEYHECRNKYYNAQKDLDNILNEKEHLFSKTQPKATDYDKERVSGGTPSNTFDDYLIAKESKQIDKRLEEAKSILEYREKLLKIKKEELRLSNNPYDKIYYNKYVLNLSPYKMKRFVGYEVSQIYRILRKIEKNVNMTQKDIKVVVE